LGALEGREAGKGQQNPFPLRKSKKKPSQFWKVIILQLKLIFKKETVFYSEFIRF